MKYLKACSHQLNPIEDCFSFIITRYASLTPRPDNSEEIIEKITEIFVVHNVDICGFCKNI